MTNNDAKNDVIFPKILNTGIVGEFVSQTEILHQNHSLITCLLGKMYFEVQIVVIF